MPEIERSAASVEEAIEAALSELGVTEQEAQVEIVQEARGGFLGIASQPAIVRVRTRGASAPAEELAPGKPGEVDAAERRDGTADGDARSPDEEQAEVAASFIDGLMAVLDLDVDVEINDAEGVTYVDVWGAASDEGMGLLIGKRGHTLEAIQELVRSFVHRETGERCRVLVDVEDYRKRRRSQILHRARDVARRVKKTGRPEALDPMSAYERKLVHDAISEMGGLETSSEGEEPARHVVVRRVRRQEAV